MIYETVENIVGKGENAGYQHFVLFGHRFLTLYSTDTHFDALILDSC